MPASEGELPIHGALRQPQPLPANARVLALESVWMEVVACGAARTARIRGGFDLVHNFVTREAERWIHRKGCAPAGVGEPAVVLGSRGAPSWIGRGQGSAACLCSGSVAHGAGRRMSRSEARAKIALITIKK